MKQSGNIKWMKRKAARNNNDSCDDEHNAKKNNNKQLKHRKACIVQLVEHGMTSLSFQTAV